MTHPRTLIRRAFLERLKAAGTDAGTRVYASRVAPIDMDDPSELPCILIYARDDKRNPDTDYGPEGEDSWVRSQLHLVVEGMAKANREVDNVLDALAEQIEAALDDWDIPGFEGACVRLAETDIDVITEGMRVPFGAIGLVWRVDYMRPWRVRPDGERPDTVDAIINGDPPERIITKDRGPYNNGPLRL